MESRKYRGIKRGRGYELHHIIPKCLGGGDGGSNLVKLTPREHYIAHSLLSKIYLDNHKIQYAFLCMLRDPHGHRSFTSKMYETIKKRFSDFKKWHIKIYNPGKSQKSRLLAKNRMLNNNPMKCTPEKNHTAKETTVHFDDESIVVFKIKKEFIEFLMERTNLTFSVVKAKIKSNEFLLKNGVTKIETTKKNKAKEISLGKKWYNNGEKNLYISAEEIAPPGFNPGMLYKRRK